MTHRKEDTSGLRIVQEAISEGDDALRMLLEHTIQRVLEEEITSFLDGRIPMRGQTSVKAIVMGISPES